MFLTPLSFPSKRYNHWMVKVIGVALVLNSLTVISWKRTRPKLLLPPQIIYFTELQNWSFMFLHFLCPQQSWPLNNSSTSAVLSGKNWHLEKKKTAEGCGIRIFPPSQKGSGVWNLPISSMQMLVLSSSPDLERDNFTHT